MIVEAFVGAKCFDTVAPVTPALAAEAKRQGYACAIRYVGMTSLDEIKTCHDAGLAVLAVTTCRGAGWKPDRQYGIIDGSSVAATLARLGLEGVTTYYDIEGVEPSSDPADLISQVNAFGAINKQAGIYVGAGALLTSRELYALNVTHYWRGLSRTLDRLGIIQEPACGWGMIQLYPTQAIAGVPVDISFIQKDYIGRLPIWSAP